MAELVLRIVTQSETMTTKAEKNRNNSGEELEKVLANIKRQDQKAKSITDRDMEALAESLYTLEGFNVKYDFGHEVVEGYYGPPDAQRWYRVTIDPCEDPDV